MWGLTQLMSGRQCLDAPSWSGNVLLTFSFRDGVQILPPVLRHAVGGSRGRLTLGTALRRRELAAVDVAVPSVVPEPPLPRLERPDDRMSCLSGVRASVLRRRRLAAADVPARGA